MTPAVSGLTEIPDTVFLADTRLEVGVILRRIDESVQQLTQILSQLGSISVARPLETAFPFIGPGLPPPVLQAPTDYMDSMDCQEENNGSEQLKSNIPAHSEAEPLSRAYISLSLNFVLGRHAFQKQEFDRAYEMLSCAQLAMLETKLMYAEEVGVTQNLLETYLKACKSYTLERSSLLTEQWDKWRLPPAQFVELFSIRLEAEEKRVEKPNANEPEPPFWLHLLTRPDLESYYYASPSKATGSGMSLSVEDQLIELLMEDLHAEDETNSSKLISPLGDGLRTRLESVSLRVLQRQREFVDKALANTKQTVSLQQLFTKIFVCNSIANLLNGELCKSIQLVTALTTKLENLSNPHVSGDEVDGNEVAMLIDFEFASDFLLDCLSCLLLVLSKHTAAASSRALSSRKWVYQLIAFITQQAMPIENVTHGKNEPNSEEACRGGQTNAWFCKLQSHSLFPQLPSECQSFIQACSNHATASESSEKKNFTLSSMPNPLMGLKKSSSSNSNTDAQFGLLQLGSDFDTRLQVSSSDSGGNRDDSRWSSGGLSSTTRDVDLRGGGGGGSGSSGFPSTQLVSGSRGMNSHPTQMDHLSHMHRLLLTYDPVEIATLTRLLARSMHPLRIVQLNMVWLPTLNRLAHIGSLASSSSHGVLEQNLIDLLLAQEPTISITVCILLIQLAKAAVLLQQFQSSTEANHIRPLLIVAMTGLTGLCSSTAHLVRSNQKDVYLWLREAIHHELLLHDLLEALVMPPEIDVSFAAGGRAAPKPHARRSLPSDLSRRAKVCLYRVAGLHAAAADLEAKCSVPPLFGLSTELVNAASCFLLWNNEQYFLLPTAKHLKSHSSGLPKGSLASRGTKLGPLELIRALLRLHRSVISAQHVSTTTQDYADEATTTISATGKRETEDESGSVTGDHHRKPDAHRNVTPGGARKQTSSLKTTINNLWNLLLFGCLIPELQSSNQNSQTQDTKSGRPQIQLDTLRMITDMLIYAATARPSSIGRFSSHSSTVTMRRNLPHHLLHYLIVCLAHITQTMSVEFKIPRPRLDKAQSTPPDNGSKSHTKPSDDNGADTLHTPVESDSDQSAAEAHLPQSRRKRTRWDALPEAIDEAGVTEDGELLSTSSRSVTSLLFSDLWPTEVSSHPKLPCDALYELLLNILQSALSRLPGRVDWLLLRGELEFHRNAYHAALSTYLEVCAIVTDAFIEPMPSCVCTEQFITRMVHCCRNLGRLSEAVVLCQLGPNDCLLEYAQQLIANPPEGVINAVDGTRKTKSSEDETKLDRIQSHLVHDQPRGACGGLLNTPPFDSMDALVDYLWNVRLLESLSAEAWSLGALELHVKFNTCLKCPELNTNNPSHIIAEGVAARTLEFLSMMAEKYLN